MDSDADDEQVASIVYKNATALLGAAPKRGSPNSHKFLMIYRPRHHLKKRLTFVPSGRARQGHGGGIERTVFPGKVAEMALAHVVTDAVERAYRRGDLFAKRRQLMDAWARFCIEMPAHAGKIVPLHARPVEAVKAPDIGGLRL